jgi:hypothetical protein
LNQSPLIPAKAGTNDARVLKCLGTNQAAVVPVQAGTHTPQQGDVAWPAITETFVIMGPRLCGDDSGESLPHIFESGNPEAENSAKKPGRAFAGTSGIRRRFKLRSSRFRNDHEPWCRRRAGARMSFSSLGRKQTACPDRAWRSPKLFGDGPGELQCIVSRARRRGRGAEQRAHCL